MKYIMICELAEAAAKMGVSEEDVMNIMGGMEHAEGIKLNDHKRKLKNRSGWGSSAFFQNLCLRRHQSMFDRVYKIDAQKLTRFKHCVY